MIKTTLTGQQWRLLCGPLRPSCPYFPNFGKRSGFWSSSSDSVILSQAKIDDGRDFASSYLWHELGTAADLHHEQASIASQDD